MTVPAWPRPPRLEVMTPPSKTDIVIVGAGLTGISLGSFLAQHDVSFVILEREAIASAASGRNAGFVLMGTAQNYAAAVDRFGRGRAQEIWHFTRENHRLLRQLLAESEGCYQQRGSWLVAVNHAEAEELQQSEALLREDGFATRWHDTVAVPESAGALHLLEDGEVIPTMAIWHMAQAISDRIYEQTAVEAIEGSAHGVTVRTAAANVEATAVIVATNGLIPRLLPTVPIIPFRGQMLATEPVPALAPFFPAYADHGFRYWRQFADGTVHVGGFRNLAEPDEMGDELQFHEVIQAELSRFATSLCGEHQVTTRWAGVMAGTPDDLPLVGALPGRLGIYLCGGYAGHGFGFATLAAKQLVESLMGTGDVPPFLRAQRAFANK